jgi:hypothetical protein
VLENEAKNLAMMMDWHQMNDKHQMNQRVENLVNSYLDSLLTMKVFLSKNIEKENLMDIIIG